MLEKIKELRVKAESAKALLSLADDETERKHFNHWLYGANRLGADNEIESGIR